MNNKTKGILCGIIAAICYGTNPLGALYLYEEGLNVNSVLISRYCIAAAILAIIMIIKKESFSVSRKDLMILLPLGILFGISSISLFMSFNHMDAGIACTLLFVYPIMVAVIMSLFFHEKINFITIASITLALSGIGLLYQGDGDNAISMLGVLLVFISSLSYAIYIVVLNRVNLTISPFKLTFWVMMVCIGVIIVYSFIGNAGHIQLLTNAKQWGFAIMLGLIPTVISLVTMSISVNLVGSTPTAIMGALEPVTAVLIGVVVFNEALTPRLSLGMLMILTGVLLIIAGKRINFNKLRTIKLLHRK